MSGRAPLVVLALAATAGLFFASFSTFDFVQHLDRQVHDIHCSFVPGLVEAEEGSEGCQLTLMSPYSSQLRSLVWGGIPISLAAMAMFAFLLFRAFDLMGRTDEERPAAADFLLASSFIPVVASGAMGWIAYEELHAACKLCIGIYVSSGVLFLAAVAARRGVLRAFVASGQGRAPGGKLWTLGILQLGAFELVPIAGYVMIAPDYSRFVGACGSLKQPDDPYGVMVAMDRRGTGVPTIEVFDPLCPACRAFERRLAASSLEPQLQRRALLFPLDAECNWMVSRSLHPGACAISEAVLCAAEDPGTDPMGVVHWAFDHQEAIVEAAKQDAGAAASMVTAQFPALKACVGSAQARQKLNQSLRWTVANELPVLTPQLYIDGVKLCDEDTDLGLDFALRRTISAYKSGMLAGVKSDVAAAPEPAAQPVRPRPRPTDPAGRGPGPIPIEKVEPGPAPVPEPAPTPPVDRAELPAPDPVADEAKAPEPQPTPEPAPAPQPKPEAGEQP